MFCPVCQQVRYKKEWRPSQWSNNSPCDAWQRYDRCKSCDPLELAGLTEGECDVLLMHLERLVQLTANPEIQQFADSFLMRWCEGSFYEVFASSGTPYGEGKDYGNCCYGLVLRLLFPQFVENRELLDMEITGDILESLWFYAELKGCHDHPFFKALYCTTAVVKRLRVCLGSTATVQKSIFYMRTLRWYAGGFRCTGQRAEVSSYILANFPQKLAQRVAWTVQS